MLLFQIWSDVTPLNFKERRWGPVNIDIRFEVGYHGDRSPFDGPGGQLGHALPPQNFFFYQYGGDAHFDDEEYWTINERSGKSPYAKTTNLSS